MALVRVSITKSYIVEEPERVSEARMLAHSSDAQPHHAIDLKYTYEAWARELVERFMGDMPGAIAWYEPAKISAFFWPLGPSTPPGLPDPNFKEEEIQLWPLPR
jgi:hypothetical protein